jgi:hypothetical protein
MISVSSCESMMPMFVGVLTSNPQLSALNQYSALGNFNLRDRFQPKISAQEQGVFRG